MTTVIGICGYAQHGKNTTADVLDHMFNDHYGISSTVRAFADPLREMALALGEFVSLDENITYKSSIDAIGYERTKLIYPKARKFLQVIGTEAVRDVLGENVWVDALDNFSRQNSYDIVIVPDTRFENEVEYVRENGILIGVIRPGFNNGVGISHASEAYTHEALRLSDYQIEAESIDELTQEAEMLSNRLQDIISARLGSYV